uniref:Protochlorophyllide reductase n=1 Tax=Corethron hystrix TaxID=216773 RepID=A0A6U5LWV8_9STRA|mmetsp:Transcript_7459/g.16155  ORF Transcript_7459/g.16155 Transcript_7459/m.16155 type:complete len:238 (+) Transcript_7459:650-1363(+)
MRTSLPALGGLGGLVLCAGIDGAPETRTAQGYELHMSVNHLGHMLLAAELTGMLRKQASAARVATMTSSAAVDTAPRFFDDLVWQTNKYDKRQAYCLSKACNILFSDHLAVREGGKILTAAIDPGPTVTQIVRYELPQRAKQREGMSASQLERQAKQLGYRTPDQAGAFVTSMMDESSELVLTSGGLYLGFLSPPGQPGPLIPDDAISWRTESQARKVWVDSANLLRPFASPDAVLA